MNKRIFFILILFPFLFLGRVNAQTTLVDSAANYPVIMQHYTYADLQSMDSAKIQMLIYYYTRSFTVTPVSCVDCVPFDSANFDVTMYESLRQWSTTFTREYDKYGFTLTLVPIKDMTYRLPLYDRYFEISTVPAPRGN